MTGTARYWIVGLLAFAILLGWMALREAGQIQNYGQVNLGEKPHPVEAELSPKLSPGVSLRQPLEWDRLVGAPMARHYANQAVCLSVYMATHGGSARGGQLQMTLEQDEVVLGTSQLAFDQLQDLRFESFCFDDLTLGEVYGQPVEMVIQATQGVETAAPSVYFDRAAEGAEQVTIGNVTHPSHGIVHRLQIKRAASQAQFSAWFILAALALLGAVVLTTRTDD